MSPIAPLPLPAEAANAHSRGTAPGCRDARRQAALPAASKRDPQKGRRAVRSLRAVLKDRKGATALIFAASAVVVFGFAALATEGGQWYYTQRNARSAADMAAMAGASSFLHVPNDQTRARTTATDTVVRNNFGADAQTSVVINTPAASGPNAGAPNSVEVIVARRMPTQLSSLFMAQSGVSIQARAVALVETGLSEACVLALRGLTLRGSTWFEAATCVLHSNKQGAASVSRQGTSMYLNLLGLTATGLCSSCDYTANGSKVAMQGSGAPPVVDPFDWANDVPMPPSLSGSACTTTQLIDWPRVTDPSTGLQTLRMVNMPSGSTSRIFCGGQSLEGQTGGGTGTWNFAPGTYYFTSDFSVKQANLTCSTCVPGSSGVTIVMAGANGAAPGVLRFESKSQVRLNAPPDGPYPGLLIYRDDAGTPGLEQIRLTGGGNTSLVGGIYGPTSGLYQAGSNDYSGQHRDCLVLIADTVDIAGGSGSAVNTGCNQVGTQVPRLRLVRLVE